MSTVLERPHWVAPPSPLIAGDSVVELNGVTWQEYSRLRDDPANDHVRMAYSDGALLLMTVNWAHERIRSLIGDLVRLWTIDRDVPSLNGGSLTMRSELTRKGIEPDQCWYFTHVEEMKSERDFDPDRHPPFDVAVEVDLTTYSLRKLDIYQALRVRELWIWKGERVRVLELTEVGYADRDESGVLPEFPLDLAAEIVRQREGRDDTELCREFIKRLRTQ